MKKLISIISAVCILTMLAGCGLIGESDKSIAKKQAEKSIMTINGENVPLELFNYYLYSAQDDILQASGITEARNIPDDFWDTKMDGKTALEVAKERALEDLVNITLQYLQAKKEGIEITAAQQSAVDKQLAQINTDQNMLSQLKQMGMNIEVYEDVLVHQCYIQNLVDKYIEDKKIDISDEEAMKQLENDYVKAKHILLMTVDQNTNQPLPDAEIAKKESTANEILAKIKDGGNFDSLIKKYNEDPGVSSAPDGYLFTKGQMVKEFEDAAYALEVGSVSDVVKTQYGFHIIKRVAINKEGAQEVEALKNIKTNLAVPKLEEFTKKWKSEAEIKKNDKLYDSVKPTIIKN